METEAVKIYRPHCFCCAALVRCQRILEAEAEVEVQAEVEAEAEVEADVNNFFKNLPAEAETNFPLPASLAA